MMNGVPQSVIQVSSSSQHSTAQHCDDEIRIHRKDSLYSVNGERATRNELGQQISLPRTCILRIISTIVNIPDKNRGVVCITGSWTSTTTTPYK
jgi:hypothetical protein